MPNPKLCAIKPGCTDEECNRIIDALEVAGVHPPVKAGIGQTVLSFAESMLEAAIRQHGTGVLQAIEQLIEQQLLVPTPSPAPH